MGSGESGLQLTPSTLTQVFTACSRRHDEAERTGVPGGGDPKAVKALRDSALADLLSNKTNIDMLRVMVQDIVLLLADLAVGEEEDAGAGGQIQVYISE
jgi:DNA phosphorothioation-dependent restriction protein DptG